MRFALGYATTLVSTWARNLRTSRTILGTVRIRVKSMVIAIARSRPAFACFCFPNC